MRRILKQLFLLFLILIIIKTILVAIIPAPTAFGDDYTYSKMARSFAYDQNLLVHGLNPSQSAPLYSILLSPAYIFNDMKIVYSFMKLINVILSSLIIFPTWLIAKEFLSKKNSLLVTILVGMLPMSFAFPAFLMAENLFYPLFLFSIYFIYKSFTEQNYKYDVLAGIFIGLVYLTRIVFGVALFPIIILILFYKLYKKEFYEIKKKIVLFLFSFLIILPWAIRNFFIFGSKNIKDLIIGTYSAELISANNSLITWSTFFIWIFIYIGFLSLASGVVFCLTNFSILKGIKRRLLIFNLIFYLTTSITILIASYFNAGSMSYFDNFITQIIKMPLAGKVVGRYVEFLLPLILINGFIGFDLIKKNYRIFKKGIYIIATILLFSVQLIFYPLFPMNNMSLVHLGILKYAYDFLIYNKTSFDMLFSYSATIVFGIVFASLPFIVLYLYKKNKLTLRKIFPYFLIFFLLLSLANYSITYYNSKNYWYNKESMQLGLWFNSFDKEKSKILFDQRDHGPLNKDNQIALYGGSELDRYSIIGFWVNDDIDIGNVKEAKDYDYVFSKSKLNLELIKQTENFYVYKV